MMAFDKNLSSPTIFSNLPRFTLKWVRYKNPKKAHRIEDPEQAQEVEVHKRMWWH
jgi:hypothetical protein